MKKIKKAIWKISILLKIERPLRSVWNFFKINIFEYISIHTYDASSQHHIIYLFGHKLCSFKNKKEVENLDKKVFYFKVNRQADYTLMCIQHWVNTIRYFDCDFYFVCDNKRLERDIVRYICFKDTNIKFIRSQRKQLKKIANNLYTKYWKNATYAHLTPFYHAKEHAFKQYWTIDADDTMFLLNPPRVAEILERVETLAKQRNTTALSLDMWRTRTHGKHWSLGVVYIRDNVDLCHYFEETTSLDWTKAYEQIDVAFNVDWYFNYLKDSKNVAIETFYVENAYFIHWGDMLRNILGCSVYYWWNHMLLLPIIKYIYQNNNLGEIPIADCFKIDIGLSCQEGLKFMENELSFTRFCGKELRRLHELKNFGSGTKYFY